MLYSLKSWSVITIAALFLSACASPVAKIDLTKGSMSQVKTIAVMVAPEPTEYTVLNLGHGGMGFGLIGGLIAAADQSDKQKKLTAKYNAEGVSLTTALATQISSALNNAGYNARVEKGNWVAANNQNTLAFDKIQSDADAVLVVSPTILGFVAAGLAVRNNDYLPTISVVTNLIKQGSASAPMYRGFHMTGWELRQVGWRYTPPKQQFADFAALHDGSKNSSKSLNEAAAMIAATVAADLKQ